MKPRFKEIYESKVVPALKEQFTYANVNQVPKLEKIVINMGVGEAIQNAKAMEFAVADMTAFVRLIMQPTDTQILMIAAH